MLFPLLMQGACATDLRQSQSEAALVLPFDSSNDQIELMAQVNGRVVRVLLDTGVDPSVIDLSTARRTNLPLSAAPIGEAAGVGDSKQPIYGSEIIDLNLGGRSFGNVDAAAMDMSGLQRGDRPKVEGILGYSFLRGRRLLIDYPGARVVIFSDESQAAAWERRCSKQHKMVLKSFSGDTIPIIPDFRFGQSTAPVSVDTGSGQSIGLLQSALQLPSLIGGIEPGPDTTVVGARGPTTVPTGKLRVPIGFGPFNLPEGQLVHLRRDQGSTQTRVANLGNRTLKQMQISLMLDYPQNKVSFLANCRFR
jgi:hypothetical protein